MRCLITETALLFIRIASPLQTITAASCQKTYGWRRLCVFRKNHKENGQLPQHAGHPVSSECDQTAGIRSEIAYKMRKRGFIGQLAFHHMVITTGMPDRQKRLFVGSQDFYAINTGKRNFFLTQAKASGNTQHRMIHFEQRTKEQIPQQHQATRDGYRQIAGKYPTKRGLHPVRRDVSSASAACHGCYSVLRKNRIRTGTESRTQQKGQQQSGR
jgi:hypothetical protein